MDKSAIRNFAVSARQKLKEQIEQKAYALGITKNEIRNPVINEDTFEVNGYNYERRSLKHRDSLITKINEKGYEEVIEEVAYTWFNRLIAIRFMEVNEYLPTGVRILSSTDPDKAEPDIIREVLHIDLDLDQELVYRLQDENNTEELFKYIFIKQCNELGKIMPVVFEDIEDYTELLLPDNLLQESSVIRELITSIEEGDWKEQVEIIGWLYQYYISEKKDEVFADLKKNKKISKDNIPAATQLFTPDWIVKYMVENSLGRLWLEAHPDEELKSKWEYYLEDAAQEPEVFQQLQVIKEKNRDLKPEDIKFLDPAMGSGHILVYAFDVLFDIYKSAGYSEREIPKLILENNLYGLDIDDRAVQLAYFAVIMKARSYSRRIFREELKLNICSIQESNDLSNEAVDFLLNQKDTELHKRIDRSQVEYLLNRFYNAKDYGSILEVEEIDFDIVEKRIEEIKAQDISNIFDWEQRNTILSRLPALIKQARIMSLKYDVVCTNPPYMGIRGMNSVLAEYLSKNYPNSKSDMFAVYMEIGINRVKEHRFVSVVNQQSWMFLSSYFYLREEFLKKSVIYNMIHLGSRAFEENVGTIVQTTAFVSRKSSIDKYQSKFVRLVDYSSSEEKQRKLIEMKNNLHDEHVYTVRLSDFNDIPGKPIAYWISSNIISIFKNNKKIGDFAAPRQGMATSDNNRFLRYWYEVAKDRIGFGLSSTEEAKCSNKKWFPYNKGGQYRKWFGNNEFVVNYENDGEEIKAYAAELYKSYTRTIKNIDFYFKEGITYTFISTDMGVRYSPKGFIFDVAGSSIFMEGESIFIVLAFLCSKLSRIFLDILNPTFNIQVGDLKNLPIINIKDEDLKQDIISITKRNIEISKNEWDSYENSWDFKAHPFIIYKEESKLIEQIFNRWNEITNINKNILKLNEKEINEIFIELYGLKDEVSSELQDDDVTFRSANREKDVKSFISYAVGCMFGRYSLDEEGLVHAGGEFDTERYKTFKLDNDNVIPITDDVYFEDDIVGRFVNFVKASFGAETLEENLDYIAETLGGKVGETSRQTIRRYFLKDFYKDHLAIYQKRPIYWLFDSGKNDGFKALIYMHRYEIGTVARIRTDYLHLLQRKYEIEINALDTVMESSTGTREKNEARKKKEKLLRQVEECRQYDQIIAHVANTKVSLDLDDGVSANYTKFQGVEVSQGEGKKPLKANLLAKI
jgi:type II restriction/modification system DNA methylase subunit YeeA